MMLKAFNICTKSHLILRTNICTIITVSDALHSKDFIIYLVIHPFESFLLKKALHHTTV